MLFVEDGVSLNAILELALATCRALVKPGVALNVEGPGLAAINARDRLRILQILLNILSNAAKFTATGSITVTASVTDETVTISVADTGPRHCAGRADRRVHGLLADDNRAAARRWQRAGNADRIEPCHSTRRAVVVRERGG